MLARRVILLWMLRLELDMGAIAWEAGALPPRKGQKTVTNTSWL